MGFAETYPLQAFSDIADANWWRASAMRGTGATPEAMAGAAEVDKRDRARMRAHLADVFLPAVMAHMGTLRTGGRLTPILGLEGRDVRPATAWNAFVAGSHVGGPDLARLLAGLEALFTLPLLSHRVGRMPVGDDFGASLAAWCAICAGCESGDLRSMATAIDRSTGEMYRIDLAGWRPTLLVRTADRSAFVPVARNGTTPGGETPAMRAAGDHSHAMGWPVERAGEAWEAIRRNWGAFDRADGLDPLVVTVMGTGVRVMAGRIRAPGQVDGTMGMGMMVTAAATARWREAMAA